MKRFSLILALFLPVLFPLNVHAGRDQGVTSRSAKLGSPIVVAATPATVSLTIQDHWYPYMLANPFSASNPQRWDEVFRLKSWATRATLRYEDSRHYAPTLPWKLRIGYDIKTYDSSGVLQTYTNEQLTINYDPAQGTSYIDKAVKSYEQTLKAELSIRTIQYWPTGDSTLTPQAALPAELNDVFLDLEYDVERFYNMTTTAPTLQRVAESLDNNNQEQLVTLTWNYIRGAESYDLEWLFIDAGNAPLTNNFNFDWRNATRVNVWSPFYTIDMAFPRGIVLFRVRAAGVDFRNFASTGYITRFEGDWSCNQWSGQTQTNAALFNNYTRLDLPVGREKNLNWQYAVSFAEDGKKSEAISFYDGALYQRQSLTKMNSDTNLIVAEPRYDHQGRAAVQLLPTPVSANSPQTAALRYQTDFNPGFTRLSFDVDSKVLTPDRLDTLSGGSSTTGRYYSGTNTATARGQSLQATTYGYGYTQVRYKNDGTNRLHSEAGIGPNYRMGSGRETRYFYGTPTQVELDRLFGSEVGFSKHYSKNMVVDANGQVAVAYLDQQGRTIATALAGDVPSNLLAIDSTNYAWQNLTASLLDNNALNQSNQIASVTTLTVPVTTTYSFNYTVGMDTACGGTCYPICETCRYDVRIWIENENGSYVNPPSNNGPLVNVTNIASGNYTFSVQLQVGVYRVLKTIGLNTANVQQVGTNFSLAQGVPGACVQQPSLSAEPCALNCDEACEQLYKRPNSSGGFRYYDAEAQEITGQPNASATAQSLIDACKGTLCKPALPDDPCAITFINMLVDMSPGGQYFGVTAADTVWLNTHAKKVNMLFAINNFPTPNAHSYVYWDQVRSNWDTAWARVLLPYHPEYCAWNYFCNYSCTYTRTFSDATITVTVTPGEANAYKNILLSSTTGDYPGSPGPTSLELFNPLNMDAVTSTSPPNLYQPYPTDQTWDYIDPYFEGTCDFRICNSPIRNAKQQLIYYLQNFLPVYNSSTQTTSYHSIWYVLNNPDSIHNATASSGLPQQTIDFYKALYVGTPSATPPEPPIIGNGSDQISKFRFFASSYMYFRELVIAQGFEVSADAIDCRVDYQNKPNYMYLTPANGNPLTANGKVIYFPKNPVLALYGNGCTEPNISNLFTAIQNQITASYQNNDTSQTMEPPTGSQAKCSCEGLNTFITNNGFSPADYTAIAGAMNNVFEAGGVTASQVSQWLTACAQTNVTMSNLTSFPSDLACPPDSSIIQGTSIEEILQNECEQENADLNTFNNSLIYQNQLNAATEAWKNRYVDQCLKKLKNKETFTVTYALKEYQYTLYYYDQADNLVKTIPPDGVRIVNLTADVLNSNGIADGTDITNHRKGIGNAPFTPANHKMLTNYKYISLQQVRQSSSPDVLGVNRIYYDNKGRVAISQNERQRNITLYPTPAWSYILYDNLGRAYESGQLLNATPLTDETVRHPASLTVWLAAATQKQQVTRTYYDESLPNLLSLVPGFRQYNIRGRASSVTYEEIDDNNANSFDQSSHFSYDIHGNVNVVAQHYKDFGSFRIEYDYDLISGVVQAVHYQPGQQDEFHHRYEYDANNRLVNAFTSRDGVIWERESRQFYYAGGALLRAEIGDKLVQGCDYAYTVQGWLKVINAGSVNAVRDIGKDSYSETITGALSINRDVGQDAMGLMLGYHDAVSASTKADYWSPALAAATSTDRFVPLVTSTATQADYRNLYNGNIAYMITALSNENQTTTNTPNQLTAYRYDQLQRLKRLRAHRNFSETANAFQGTTGDDGSYRESFTYDHNGNILFTTRNGNQGGSNQSMDQLTYRYIDKTGAVMTYSTANGWSGANPTNRLGHVVDNQSVAGRYTTDVDNQNMGNYTYDGIGNLVGDASEQIATIDWRADGKIRKITRTLASSKADLEFVYDVNGNRICKIEKPRIANSGVKSQLHWKYTFYTRDVQGNVMGVYERSYSTTGNTLSPYSQDQKIAELHIYGGKRLGMVQTDVVDKRWFSSGGFSDVVGATFNNIVYGPVVLTQTPCTTRCVKQQIRRLGKKLYELSNHLGNVLEVVTDRKLNKDNYSYTSSATGNYVYNTLLNTYYAVAPGSGTHNRVNSMSDQKADGYTADVVMYSDHYAFGGAMPGRTFTGTTKFRYDFNGEEKDSESGLLDYGMRIYDPKIGKFLSVDPMAHERSWVSPYNFVQNNPINRVDPTGALDDWVQDADGNIKWDKDANDQATTKPGETYLGKTLTFTFNSYIDKNLWDGPGGSGPAGDKLTSTISLTGNENEAGELTGLTATKSVKIGETPIGTARDYFPGLGADQNKFSFSGTQHKNGLLTSATLNFEQHASVSPIEAFGLGLMGYDIVNVAQNLQLSLSGNQLSVTAATDIFPSATLTMNGRQMMYYPQPSFKGTHGYKKETVFGDNGMGGSTTTEYTPLRPAPSFYIRFKK